jgi:hypothetical protein
MGADELTSIIPQWIQDLNTGFSFFGFLITLIVMFEVKEIKASFLRRARLPQVTKELAKAGSLLSSSLNQWPLERIQVHCQIKVAASLLKTAGKMLPKDEKKEVKKISMKLVNAAAKFNEPQFSDANSIWDLYSDIQSVLMSMDQLSKNIKWE